MKKDDFTYGYTPIFNYTASGINWLFEHGNWKSDRNSEKYQYCIPEGVKLILIISMASVIEGSLKSFLRGKIQCTLKRQKEIQDILAQEEHSDESYIEQSAEIFIELDSDDFRPDPTDDELRNEYAKNNVFLKEVSLLSDNKIMQTINNIKAGVGQVTKSLFQRLDIKYDTFSATDELTFDAVIKAVDGCTWSKLKLYFENINNIPLSDVLNTSMPNLLEEINALFNFRNFVIHGNALDLKFNEVDVVFDGRTKELIQYLKDKNFYSENLQDKYIIEILLPDDLIVHFKLCYDAFLKSPIFRENFELQNLVNTIWRG